MTAQDVNVNRDVDNDVLYVMKKGADKSTTQNISATADVLLRINPATRKVVGLTIEDFSEVFPELKSCSDWELMELFDGFIEVLNGSLAAMSSVKC